MLLVLTTTQLFAQKNEDYAAQKTQDSIHHNERHSWPASEISVHITKSGLNSNNTIKDWALRVWALHSFKKGIELEAHGGFNYENTLNVNAGYNVTHKKGQRWFVPKGGVMIGSHWGLSAGFMNQFEYKKLYVFNTVEFGFNFIHQEDQLFNFLEVGYEAHKYLEVGFILDNRYHFYRGDDHREKTEDNFDVGPVIRAKYRKVYFELWYATSPVELDLKKVFIEDAKLTLGFGWKF